MLNVSSINQGGEFEPLNGKVKWGPFLDRTPRTLVYQVLPPQAVGGTARFAGAVSFDGVSSELGGGEDLMEGCRLNVEAKCIPGQFCFTFAGRTGASIVLETSIDLLTWTRWSVVSNQSGTLSFNVPTEAGDSHQFFRARLAE